MGTASLKSDVTPAQVYNALIKELIGHFERSKRDVPVIESSDPGIYRSLIETKTILVASRLSDRPCAMILDEPEWGFSRAVAEAFVLATTHVAHDLSIPVLLISHKPWWNHLAASTLRVTKRIMPNENLEIRLSVS